MHNGHNPYTRVRVHTSSQSIIRISCVIWIMNCQGNAQKDIKYRQKGYYRYRSHTVLHWAKELSIIFCLREMIVFWYNCHWNLVSMYQPIHEGNLYIYHFLYLLILKYSYPLWKPILPGPLLSVTDAAWYDVGHVDEYIWELWFMKSVIK